MSYSNSKITIEFDSVFNELDYEKFVKSIFLNTVLDQEPQITVSQTRYITGCKKPGCHCLDKSFGVFIDIRKIKSSDQFRQLKKDLFVAISQLEECPVFVEILSEVISE